MVRLLLILLITLPITGCSWFKVKDDPVEIIKTVEVQVPVFTCPSELTQVEIPKRPTLALSMLSVTDNIDHGKVAKSYKLSVMQLQQYSRELEQFSNLYVNVCKDLPK